MLEPSYKVRRVKGANPERFVIVAVNVELPSHSFMVTSDALTETEMRARLTKDFGCAKSELDSVIADARDNPPI